MLHSFFLIPQQSPGNYPSFCFLLILLGGQPEQDSPKFDRFSFFVGYKKVRLSGRD